MKPASEVQQILRVYRSHFDSDRSSAMAAYMRSHFEFLGIPSPLRKELSKEFLKINFRDEEAIRRSVQTLWDQSEREFQYLAIELMDRKKKFWTAEWIDLIERLIITKSWWDSVDGLAARIAGNYFLKFPENKDLRIEVWINSDNMWLNRTAIIFQLKYKDDVDTDILSRSILKHRTSREFFHEKAIGWALRQYSKFNPVWVRDFITSHKLRPLSVREASKYI